MPVVVVASARPEPGEELQIALAGDDLSPVFCATGPEAIRTAFERRAAAVIVDLRIPGMDALRLISLLRSASELAIVAVAEQYDVDGCVQAIEAGADDVTNSDTSISELAARLRAVLRRVRRADPAFGGNASMLRTGTLRISTDSRTITKRGRPVHLSKIEFRLLAALCSRAGQPVPYRVLLNSVWGRALSNDVREVRLYVRYLRSKLEDDPSNPRYLLTERGLGYRLALLPPIDDDSAPFGTTPAV